MFELEEGHGSILELPADDALCPEPQPVAVERHRPLEIGDRQRQDRDSWPHRATRHPTFAGIVRNPQRFLPPITLRATLAPDFLDTEADDFFDQLQWHGRIERKLNRALGALVRR